MKVLKICPTEWVGVNRDIRELSVCRELGADVKIIAKGKGTNKYAKDFVDGFEVRYLSTRPLGTKMPNSINRIASLFSWAHHAKEFHADVISGHDITGLFIGWLSNCFLLKNNRSKLVYDSHEFEVGRNAERGILVKWFVMHLERFLIRRCAFSIMVNDSIADEVQRIYKLKQRSIVVRNTSNYWNIVEGVVKQTRHKMLSNLSFSDDVFTIMYHGGLVKDRGIESVIELVSINANIVGIILGNGDEGYLTSLRAFAAKKGVSNRILFHPAVPISELWKYVGAADVGMVIVKNSCASYYYMLPNKFFENIQSMTPVICSDFPEISRLLHEYRIGLTCNPDDLNALNACVEKMRTDLTFYKACKSGLIKAKGDLCWEKEKETLKKAYEGCT